MQNSIKMTLGETVQIHGVTLKKAKFGVYLRNLQLEKEFSKVLQRIVGTMQNIKDGDYSRYAVLLADLLDELVRALSDITDSGEAQLKELSFEQLCDVWSEYQKLNDLTAFFESRPVHENGSVENKENWVQRWIAVGLSIGLTKDAMLNDYYLDELITIVDMHNAMHSDVKDVDAEDF